VKVGIYPKEQNLYGKRYSQHQAYLILRMWTVVSHFLPVRATGEIKQRGSVAEMSLGKYHTPIAQYIYDTDQLHPRWSGEGHYRQGNPHLKRMETDECE